MQVVSADSTELFVGPPDAPLQLARVTVSAGAEPTPVRIDGDGLSGEAVAGAGARSSRFRSRWTSGRRSAAGRAGARRRRPRAVRVHRGRARLDHVHGQPLPLRPGLVEHPGRLYQRVDRGPAGAGPADERLRAGARASGNGAPRARVQVRAGRGGLPQAVLGHPPRGPRRPAPVHRRGPRRGDGRHLQRTEHQPHQPGDDDPKPGARHRFSA